MYFLGKKNRIKNIDIKSLKISCTMELFEELKMERLNFIKYLFYKVM